MEISKMKKLQPPCMQLEKKCQYGCHLAKQGLDAIIELWMILIFFYMQSLKFFLN